MDLILATRLNWPTAVGTDETLGRLDTGPRLCQGGLLGSTVADSANGSGAELSIGNNVQGKGLAHIKRSKSQMRHSELKDGTAVDEDGQVSLTDSVRVILLGGERRLIQTMQLNSLGKVTCM